MHAGKSQAGAQTARATFTPFWLRHVASMTVMVMLIMRHGAANKERARAQEPT
jgi:hypothetical protein